MHEKLNSLILESERYFKIADHLTYVSYPVIKEVRLLINITENLNNSLKKCVEAILFYERLNKNIQIYPLDFESQLQVLREIGKKYSITSEDIKFLLYLDALVKQHKISKMEFVRKDKYIICDDSYRIKSLTIEDIKQYVAKAKVFILSLSKLK